MPWNKTWKSTFFLLQTFLKNADVPYWIGLQKGSFPWYDYGWLEEEDPDSEGDSAAWFWVDGSLYERYMAALPLPKTSLWHGSRKRFKPHQYPAPGTGPGKQRASEQQGLREGGCSGAMGCSEDTQMESQDSGVGKMQGKRSRRRQEWTEGTPNFI